MMTALKFVILVIVSYFFGNISFARIIAKREKNDDITSHGSGNPGTMNMVTSTGKQDSSEHTKQTV